MNLIWRAGLMVLMLASALVLTASLSGTGSAQPREIKVPQDFPTIQQAIEAAQPEDTILIAPGVYQENVLITKPLTLRGESTFLGESETSVIVRGFGPAPTILICNAAGVVVENLALTHNKIPSEAALAAEDFGEGAQVTVRQVHAFGALNGVRLGRSDAPSECESRFGFSRGPVQLVVADSLVAGNEGWGLLVERTFNSNDTELAIENSSIVRNGQGIASLSGARLKTFTIRGSTITDNRGVALSDIGAQLLVLQHNLVARNGSGVVVNADVSRVELNVIVENGRAGVFILPNTRAVAMSENVILRSLGCGVQVDVTGGSRPQVEGINNEISGNQQDLCPLDFPWPPGFRKSATQTLQVCPSGCPFTKIQDALDAASEGDTIQVGAGRYRENLEIAKRVSLVGTGAEQTVLSGPDFDKPIIHIRPDTKNVLLTGFTITYHVEESGSGTGINLSGSASVTIKESTFTNLSEGVELTDQAQAEVYTSIFKDNGRGFLLQGQAQLELQDSTIQDSFYFEGILTYDSARVKISNGTFSTNFNADIHMLGQSYLEAHNSIFNTGITLLDQAQAHLSNLTLSGKENILTDTGIRIGEQAQAEILGSKISGYRFDGIFVAGTAVIRDNVIKENIGCGVRADKMATITGSSNEISGNKGGDLCPPGFPWPPNFMRTETSTARAELLEWAIPLLPEEINLPGTKNITVDATGNVWYARSGGGTVEGRVGRFDPCMETFRFWKPSSTLADEIQHVGLDAQDRLYWIGSGEKPYIARLDPALPSSETNTTVWFLNEAVPDFDPQDLAVDAQGVVWLLNRLGASGPSLLRFLPDVPEAQVEILPLARVTQPRALALDAEGGLWLALTGTAMTASRSLARYDRMTDTLITWEIPAFTRDIGASFAEILQVNEEGIWAVLSPAPLPIAQSTILQLEPGTNRLTVYHVPSGFVQELALDPGVPASAWLTSGSEALRAELTASQTLQVQPATVPLPLIPIATITLPGHPMRLEEESLTVQHRARVIEARVLFSDAQFYPLDFVLQGLQFRGIDLFLSDEGTARLAQLRPLPEGVESLPLLCARPLRQIVSSGETAIFTLTGDPRVCCDRLLQLSIESIEPELAEMSVVFEPYDFLGGLMGVPQTQLKLTIPKTGSYKITIKGTVDGAGPSVKQVVYLIVEEPTRVLRVPEDFPAIQAAIDAARDGNTIIVSPGVYQENLLIRKRLTIRGVSRLSSESGTVVLYGTRREPTVLICNAQGVTL